MLFFKINGLWSHSLHFPKDRMMNFQQKPRPATHQEITDDGQMRVLPVYFYSLKSLGFSFFFGVMIPSARRISLSYFLLFYYSPLPISHSISVTIPKSFHFPSQQDCCFYGFMKKFSIHIGKKERAYDWLLWNSP